MPRLPRYCEIINKYIEHADSYLEATYGNRRYFGIRDNLLRVLMTTLMTGRAPHDNLPDRKLKSMIRNLRHQIRSDDHRLQRAWFENRIYGTSRRTAAFRWHVNPAEMKCMEQMWTDLHYSRDEYRTMLAKIQPTWAFEVDESHEEVFIWLDDRAIEDIVLVALEAYAVPKGRGLKFTETYGICFGSTKATEEKRQAHGRHTTRYVYISSVHIQVRAECYSNKVNYDVRSLETQMTVARHLFPQLDIVGDFHTHPYKTVEECKAQKGWHYSGADEDSIRDWASALNKTGYTPRTSIIVAIAEGERKISRPARIKPNIIRFSIGKYHFYIACYRIINNRYSDRYITLNSIALPAI